MNKIVFGNYESQLVDFKNKQYIIDFLYNHINLSDFRYNILNIISKLKFLKENIHYVAQNYKGNNHLVIMLTINNEKICVAINRKQLSYHRNKIDINTLKMYKINISNFYNDTILDCKLINQNILLISDCFYLSGINLINLDLDSKLDKLKDLTNNLVSKNCKFELIKIYNYSDLPKLIDQVKINKNDSVYNGLIFYPKRSGINIIFVNENQDNNNLNQFKNNVEIKPNNFGTKKNIFNYIDFLLNRDYNYYHFNKKEDYWIGKTEITDVYNVFKNVNDSDAIGIACIPNLKISKLCKENINDKLELFECIYIDRFNKWMPYIKKNKQ
jgi:hypothetical protein